MAQPQSTGDVTTATAGLYPLPPPYFAAFSDSNLARYDEHRAGPSRTSATPQASVNRDEQTEVLSLQSQLEPPSASVAIGDARWVTFGQLHTLATRAPTSTELGLPIFIDPNEPPESALRTLHHSLLHTLLVLLDVLTTTPRNPGELMDGGWTHEADQAVQHATNLAAGAVVVSNQLRPSQAEATLEMLLEKQLAERRSQTAALRSKCGDLSRRLVTARAMHDLDSVI